MPPDVERNLPFTIFANFQRAPWGAFLFPECIIMKPIFHITLPERWAEALKNGDYRADSLESEGFIHCSDEPQVVRSLNRFYKNIPEVRLLLIDPSCLRSRLEYEPAHGELFPHIYGPLNVDAVVAVETLRAEADGSYRWEGTGGIQN